MVCNSWKSDSSKNVLVLYALSTSWRRSILSLSLLCDAISNGESQIPIQTEKTAFMCFEKSLKKSLIHAPPTKPNLDFHSINFFTSLKQSKTVRKRSWWKVSIDFFYSVNPFALTTKEIFNMNFRLVQFVILEWPSLSSFWLRIENLFGISIQNYFQKAKNCSK